MGNKKARILMSTVIYSVFVIAFIAILFIFVSRMGSDVSSLEKNTAAGIALMIDSAEPGTRIMYNLEDVLEESKDVENPVRIEDNLVIVKLSDKSGFSYAFFNDLEIKYEIREIDEMRYMIMEVRE